MTAVLERRVERTAVDRDRRWLGLSALLAATIMNLLDSTVVNVAAPSIRGELGGSYASLQWIAASYTLAMAVGLLTGGRLGDMFGRKRMLLAGVSGFVFASVLCAMAVSPGTLIGARVLQGLSGALMLPQSFGLIRDLFGRDMGKAFAVFGPAIGLSTILGPVVAGVLINADVAGTGWRMIFGINLPLGAYALWAGVKALPVSTGTGPRRLDVISAVLGGAGMGLFVYPLVQGRELNWPLWTIVMLVAAVGVFAVFVRRQLRRTARGLTPLIELSVFGKRSYRSGVTFIIVFFGAIGGFALTIGTFLQIGLGYTPMMASFTISTWAVGAFLGSAYSSTAGANLGRSILHLGLGLMAVGIAGVYVVFRLAGTDVTGWNLAAPLFCFGLGMGMIFVPLFGIIMGDIADREVGSAAALLESLQQAGATLGVAVLGTLFFGAIADAGPSTLEGALAGARLVVFVTLGLIAVAFGLACLLPKKSRT